MDKIGYRTPVIVVTQAFNEMVARKLLQMRIADFLVKPITPIELVRACSRVAQSASRGEMKEAQIYTFLPSAGGVGATTLAIQSALTLLGSKPRGSLSTCLVDLDFHHGACADYLDIEPRLDLKEIEPNPERLDRQLLEGMLSHHSSGLAVIAAPYCPTEMRPFDPNVVMRLLNLACSYFDYIVIDMPRTWYSWTDNVLLGSNKLFLVSEMTVPGLRRVKELVATISKRLGQGPHAKVVVNRYEQRFFTPGLRRADIIQALGDAFACTVPYNYRLVREAIDRGVPLEEVKRNNNIAVEIRKLILPRVPDKSKSSLPSPARGKPNLIWAR
jgi:pilus assembly protein CpaE